MTKQEWEIVLSPTDCLENGHYPGLRQETVRHDGFVLHRDVEVHMRDGVMIYVDVYRPTDETIASPTLIAWSPYGKHGLKNLSMMPGAGVDPSWVSKHAIWEGPDPEFWCRQGYTVISPDPRGAWASEGTLTYYTDQEANDGYDLIEWAAVQPWSNGKVGMLGVSYLAISQWFIAATHPPSLAAICPWEGLSDVYREVFFHGGIPEEGFLHWWQPRSRWSQSPAEDIVEMCRRHPLLDDYWKSKEIMLDSVEVPAFVVASWGDQGMHTRGTLEGFKRISSKQKWLMVHGQKKWKSFYEPTSVAKQLAFFEHFLRGVENDVPAWPPVEIEIRETNENIRTRTETSWPLSRTEPWKLYLHPATSTLSVQVPADEEIAAYSSTSSCERLIFRHKFVEDTEITGGAGVHLVMSADEAEEIDVFVALRKSDGAGKEVGFNYYSTFSDGPVALGWMRASHRRPLPSSAELQPIHGHGDIMAVMPGAVIEFDVEIWPSGTLFRAGDTLELIIGGTDLYVFDTGAPELRHATQNKGTDRLYSGPDRPSYLLLPRIPLSGAA